MTQDGKARPAPTRPAGSPLQRAIADHLGLDLTRLLEGGFGLEPTPDPEQVKVTFCALLDVETLDQLREQVKPDAIRQVEALERQAGVHLCRRSGPLTETDAQALLDFAEWLERNPRQRP